MKCDEALARIAPIQDEFEARYLQWCLGQIDREILADFPTVRRIPSHAAMLFLEFIEKRSREEILAFLTGGVGEYNPRGFSRLGVPLTQEQVAQRQQFREFFRTEIDWHGQRLSSVRIPAQEARIQEREYRGETTTNIRARELRPYFERALAPVLGKPEKGTGGLQYVSRTSSWHVRTILDFSGQAQLGYTTAIWARRSVDLCPTYLKADISPMSALGIHPETKFDLIERSTIEGAAQGVAEFTAKVMAAIPGLLNGLSHDLPERLEM